MAEIMNENVN